MRRALFMLVFTACFLLTACNKSSGQGAVENSTNHHETALTGAPSIIRTVPFELNADKVYLPVYVNGAGPFPFILDTGSVTTVLDTERAEKLGIPLHGYSTARGVGEGTAESRKASDVSLKIANLATGQATVEVLSLNSMLSSSEGHAVDGLLGYDFFCRYIVEIDYVKRMVNLYDPQTYRYTGSGKLIPLEMIRKNPHVNAQVFISGQTPLEGKFLVDTGSRTTLTLTTPFVDDHDLLARVGKTVEAKGAGIGGASHSRVGRLQKLRMGDVVIDDLPAEFAQATSGVLSDYGFDGIIGGAILSRFKVIVDYPHSRLILEPTSETARPLESDMSGLSVIAGGENLRTFKVRDVIGGSPASEAGVRPGDVIEALDGHAASDLTLEQVCQTFSNRTPENHSLRIQRGTQHLQINIRLRQYI